jgi:peptide/nickel transport system substrate-binding protein
MNLRNVFVGLALMLVFALLLGQAGAQEYKPVEITIHSLPTSYTPPWVEGTKMAAEWWRKLGIKVKVLEEEVSAGSERFLNRKHQAQLWGFSARPDRLDPQLFMDLFVSTDKMNSANYKNPEYDEIVRKARVATDSSERQRLVYRAQELLARDVPAIFLFHFYSLAVYNPARFKNLQIQVGDNPFWNVWNLMSAEPQGNYAYIRATTRQPQTLNPMGSTYSADIEIQQVLYDRLVETGLDGSVQPWAATGWKWEDPTTLTIKLRPGMKWHDGKEVTSKDVKFTMEYLKKWEVPYLRSYYIGIKSVDTPDDLTVVFRLKEPNAAFVNQSLAQLFIMPEHVWAGVVEKKGLSHPSEWKDPESRIGSGPFKVAYFDREDKVVYNKFKDHFIADKIRFDTLVYKVYGNMDVALGAVETGEATFADTLQTAQFERAQKNKTVIAVSAPTHGFAAIWLNNEQHPFDDKAMRIAVNYATDKEKIIEAAMHRQADLAWSPIAPANKFWHNPAVIKYKFDLQKARTILKEAGYKWDSQGYLLRPVAK